MTVKTMLSDLDIDAEDLQRDTRLISACSAKNGRQKRLDKTVHLDIIDFTEKFSS
jgi:hypothetical protein